MNGMRRLIIAAALAGLTVVAAGAVAFAADNGAAGNRAAPVPGYPGGINNPKLVACMQARRICNPEARSWKQLTSLPVAQPPATGARIDAPAMVTAQARKMFHAAAGAPAASALMTGRTFEHLFKVDRNSYINENRPVWIVTVKTPVRTDGSPARPGKLFDHASAVIDAQSGAVTDVCIGCAWVPVR